jgi:ABC-type bacteriocin/lantibiotic exporter with double-glycine peptidase domain
MNNTSRLTPVQRFFRLAVSHRSVINNILLYALFIGAISLSLPLGIQAIIGLTGSGTISASWVMLVAIVILGVLASGVLRYLQLSATEFLQRRLLADSAFEFAFRIPHLNLEKLRQEHLPELVNRFFDTLTIQKGIPKILIDGSTAVLQVVFSLLLVSFYHPIFLSFSFVVVVIFGLLFYLTFSSGLDTSLKESKFKYKIAYWLEEVGRIAPTFKLAGSYEMPVLRTDALVTGYLEARRKHFRVLLIQFFGSLTLRVLIIGSFLIVGSLLVMKGDLNIGQFVAAEILMLFVAEALEKIILTMETLYDVLTAIEKIGQVSDLELEPQDGLPFSEVSTGQPLSVEWRDLTYSHPDSDVPALSGLNLSIRAGEKIAVSGYNGSGKSTLMQINSGLVRDFKGAVLYNGFPMNNLNINSLRSNIGDLSSQEDIFKGSVLDNILIGRDVPLSTVLKTVEALHLHGFVQSLPQGLNTELLPSGKGVPGHIIRKILLARAVVVQPAMLVLEEPTAQLGAADRILISNLLTAPDCHWTLLCVTEDPVLAAQCDRVVIMQQGKIVETGTFADVRKTEHFEKVFRIALNQ